MYWPYNNDKRNKAFFLKCCPYLDLLSCHNDCSTMKSLQDTFFKYHCCCVSIHHAQWVVQKVNISITSKTKLVCMLFGQEAGTLCRLQASQPKLALTI